MNDIVVREDTSLATVGVQDFVTVHLDGQQVGIPVLAVHDVLNAQQITVIDLRRRLGLPPLEEGKSSMSVVVEHNEDP